MELEGIYKHVDCETCSNGEERELDRAEDIYANEGRKLSQTEARAQNYRGVPGGRKCAVLSTVFFSLMCVLLLATIVVLHSKLTAEREINATSMLQTGSRYQTEKDQLQSSFISVSQKKLELEARHNDLTAEKGQLETRINDLTAEKGQLQGRFDALSQKKLELEARVNDLTAEKGQLQRSFDALSKKKLELEARVNDLTAEKGQLQRSFDALSQKKLELEARVNDLTAEKGQLQRSFDALSKKKLELEARVNDLTAEKGQFQSNFSSLSQKKLELEARVNDLTAQKGQLQRRSDALNQKNLELETKVKDVTAEKSQLSQKKLELETELRKLCKKGNGWFFMSNELIWSESRQYCRDRGADLVIINTEEKQRFISSLVKDRVWIGLSDIENEGNMKWVDNSTLNQGFWDKGEPNDENGIEDCIELIPSNSILKNWNDLPCSEKRKGICETLSSTPTCDI